MKPRVKIYLSILLVGLLYTTLVLLSANTKAFWTTDGGNKFIQVVNFIENNSFSIHYPAEDIDTKKELFPYGGHHFKNIDNKIKSFYPPYFPLLTTPFYGLAGFTGLYILPLISSIMVLIIAVRIGTIAGIPDKLTPPLILLLALGTPLFFYSITFWEHIPALLPAMLSVYMAVKVVQNESKFTLHCILGGLFMALSTVLREEGYIMFVATVSALSLSGISWRKSAIFSAGFLLGILPLWIFQYMEYGHILGIHATVYNSMPKDGSLLALVIDKLTGCYTYLLHFAPTPDRAKIVSTLLVIPFIATLFAGFTPKTKYHRLKLAIVISCCVAGTIMALRVMLSNAPLLTTLSSQALLTPTPFIIFFTISIFATLRKKADKEIRFIALTVILFIAGTLLCLNTSDIGIIWGARHFLCIYPLLVILSLHCFYNMKQNSQHPYMKRAFTATILYLVVLSILVQVWGVRLLLNKKHVSAKITNALAQNSNSVIVSDIFWLPEEIPTLFFSKKILQIRSIGDLAKIVALLRKNGVRSFTLVLSPLYRRIDSKEIDSILDTITITPGKIVSTPGFELLKVQFFECNLKKEPQPTTTLIPQ